MNGSACRLVRMLSRPKMRHEPGQAGRGQAVVARRGRGEPQRGQVDQAAPVGAAQLVVVAVAAGAPRRSTASRFGACRLVAASCARPVDRQSPSTGRARTAARPARCSTRRRAPGARSKVRPCSSTCRARWWSRSVSRRNGSRWYPSTQPVRLDAVVVAALLGQGVLDLEQVGEVAADVDPDGQVGRLLGVVEDGQLLSKPRRWCVAGRPRPPRRCTRCRCRGPGRTAPRSTAGRRLTAGSAAGR